MAGPLRGYRIVTSWHDYPAAITGRTERALLSWFVENVKPGETWLDIGAHYGYTAIALSRLVGPGGRVFAFEPMIGTAGCVLQTRQLNRLHQLIVLPLGLGSPDTLEMVELPTTRGMVDASLARADKGKPAPESRTSSEEEGYTIHQARVLVALFDWLWPRICNESEQIDGVKIDVQGMELEVLQGMADMLSRWRPKLAIELHAGVERAELLSAIESAGYVARGVPIEPIAGEIEPLYVDDHSYAFFPVDGVEQSRSKI